ncbi:MAG TPA: hypothetical protein VFI91_07715 [Longimicrobiaceae bacterium]|nr:hypothetical protein [Longimicrobiaceae bacterium]
MRFTRMAVLGMLVLLAGACASAAGNGGSSYSNSDNLTRTEIMDAHVTTALDAVRKLRPGWLRTRGVTSTSTSSEIAVYLDGIRAGGPSFLRSLPSTSVTSMEFLDASSATQRWGTNHVHGAILVSTRS